MHFDTIWRILVVWQAEDWFFARMTKEKSERVCVRVGFGAIEKNPFCLANTRKKARPKSLSRSLPASLPAVAAIG